MPFESFDPTDSKYKKTIDLPEIVRDNFQDTPDGGFVRKEAVIYQEATEYRAKMRSKDGQPVTGLELAEEEARRLEARIQQQTADAINRLESSLGQPLSEEAKKEVYAQNASFGHQSTGERQQLHDEQVAYKNNQIAKLAQEISNLSETDFQALTREEKQAQLSSLAEFNRYIPNAEKPKALDAATERLLRSYEPSEALSAIHQEAHQEVLDTLTPSEIFDLAYGLTDYDEARSLALFQKMTGQFAHAYGIEPVEVFIAEASHNDLERAAFFTEDGKLGIVRDSLRSSSYELPEFLSHEMAHAHQKKMLTSEVTPSLATDTTSFELDEKLESVYGRTFYVNNYPFIAKEQDAKKAGLAFAESFRTTSDKMREYYDALLKEQNFPPLGEMYNQSRLAQRAEKLLLDESIPSSDVLIQSMFNDDPFLTEEDLSFLPYGKSRAECQQSILRIKDRLQQVRALLDEKTRNS